jgi:hypothetical protein
MEPQVSSHGYRQEPDEQPHIETENDESDDPQPIELVRQVIKQDRCDPRPHIDGEPRRGKVEDPSPPFSRETAGRLGRCGRERFWLGLDG